MFNNFTFEYPYFLLLIVLFVICSIYCRAKAPSYFIPHLNIFNKVLIKYIKYGLFFNLIFKYHSNLIIEKKKKKFIYVIIKRRLPSFWKSFRNFARAFKHFLNYSENGIKVIMYMTMIVAILILIYKKTNEIKSYKIAKYEFTEELNMEIIKEIVVICDGDPNKSPLFNTS